MQSVWIGAFEGGCWPSASQIWQRYFFEFEIALLDALD